MKELPESWSELGEFIREQRNLARLSVRRLSELAGVSNPYLSQIERGLRRPSAEILQQIAKGLAISAETLYVRAGILEAREVGGDLADAIQGDPNLREDQKQTLLRIYLSFRRENEPRDDGEPAPVPAGHEEATVPATAGTAGTPATAGTSETPGTSGTEEAETG